MKKPRSPQNLGVSASLRELNNPQAKPALVPKLRFPEFRGLKGWSEGQVADIAVSESSSRALNKLVLKSEGFPVYGADSCVGFIDAFDQADDYIAIVKDGSGVGRLALKRGESSVLGTLAYIKCKPGSETLLTWLYYCLGSLDLRQFIKGSGIPHIYFSDYATHGVLIPPPPEQQKIAECLSSVDELIGAQARKVDALKTHKKGLMQQLFPQEGQTQPRLRFPEFRNAGEWVTELFAELYDFKPTNTFSRDQLNYESGPAKNIHYGDIHTKFSTSFRIQAEDVPFVNPSPTLLKLKPDAYCEEGDMVFADASEDLGDVGKSIELVELNGEKVLSGSHTILARQKEKIFSVGFAGHLFKGRGVRAQIEKESQGTKVLQISPGRLAGIKVAFPRNGAEQQRIADCLSSLDDLIAAEARKLEALRVHKKGLMQQLFPNPEELAP